MLIQSHAAMLALSLSAVAVAQNSQERIRIENSGYIVEVLRANGAIARLYDKHGRTELISEPRLADNFRILVPLPDLEGNYVLGTEQKLARSEQKGDTLTLYWQAPLTNAKGSYDINARMTITLADPVEVKLFLDNHSGRSIDETDSYMTGIFCVSLLPLVAWAALALARTAKR